MKRNKVTERIILPSENDFDQYSGCLDAQTAWKNFGGLSVDAAYDKFCNCPDNYQEDFMWMGPKAFSFYFDVLERYLTTIEPDDESDDCKAEIIGCGVIMQLHNIEPDILINRILKLSNLVIERFMALPVNDKTKKRVIRKWKEVKTKRNQVIKRQDI